MEIIPLICQICGAPLKPQNGMFYCEHCSTYHEHIKRKESPFIIGDVTLYKENDTNDIKKWIDDFSNNMYFFSPYGFKNHSSISKNIIDDLSVKLPGIFDKKILSLSKAMLEGSLDEKRFPISLIRPAYGSKIWEDLNYLHVQDSSKRRDIINKSNENLSILTEEMTRAKSTVRMGYDGAFCRHLNILLFGNKDRLQIMKDDFIYGFYYGKSNYYGYDNSNTEFKLKKMSISFSRESIREIINDAKSITNKNICPMCGQKNSIFKQCNCRFV